MWKSFLPKSSIRCAMIIWNKSFISYINQSLPAFWIIYLEHLIVRFIFIFNRWVSSWYISWDKGKFEEVTNLSFNSWWKPPANISETTLRPLLQILLLITLIALPMGVEIYLDYFVWGSGRIFCLNIHPLPSRCLLFLLYFIGCILLVLSDRAKTR